MTLRKIRQASPLIKDGYAYFYFLKCIKNFANYFSLCYNGVMQRWSSWLMASASKAEEPQGSGGSNPSRCVFFFSNELGYMIQIHCFFSLWFFQECLGILEFHQIFLRNFRNFSIF